MLLLSPIHLNPIRAHAEAAYPQECCGLLLGTLEPGTQTKAKAAGAVLPVRRVEHAIATANSWSDAVAQELAAEFSSYRFEAGSRAEKGSAAGTFNPPAPGRSSTSHSQADRFWIDPKDILRAQRQARDLGLAIVGVYHSHPDHEAVPSECDRAIAWSDYSYLIVAVHHGSATDVQSWTLDEHRQFRLERMGVSSPILSPTQS